MVFSFYLAAQPKLTDFEILIIFVQVILFQSIIALSLLI